MAVLPIFPIVSRSSCSQAKIRVKAQCKRIAASSAVRASPSLARLNFWIWLASDRRAVWSVCCRGAPGKRCNDSAAATGEADLMRGTMLIVHPPMRDPEVKEADWAAMSEWQRLEWLKAGIGGGYLEVVPYFKSIEHNGVRRDCVAFCDEDGKRKQLPYNPVAQARWEQAMRRAVGCGPNPDYLVGQIAVLFGDHEFMEAL